MDRNSNTYTFIFSIIMIVVVAGTLSIIAVKLQPRQDKNIRVEKMRNILSAINIESTARNVSELFNEYITESYVVDINGNSISDIDAFEIEMREEIRKNEDEAMFPIFKANKDNSIKYIFALHGRGLWGPIWGYMSLESDMNTVFGAYFSHQAETPGLGAEIDTDDFQAQFIGKQLFDRNNDFISIKTVKGGVRNEKHEVDAISGGTITCNGLSDMIKDCFELYLGFIKKNK